MINELIEKNCKILPYASVEDAFLHFNDELTSFKSNRNSTLFHNGRENLNTGLKPRELFGLIVVANVANYLSGDVWVPGAIVSSDGYPLPGDVAHDGVIQCVDGIKKGQYMWFEQVLATVRGTTESLQSIEEAILYAAYSKSSKGKQYGTNEMALIVFADYSGNLNDLRALTIAIRDTAYKAVFVVARISKNANDCVCIILKSPGDVLGPIRVSFKHPNGKADVARLLAD